MNNLSKEKKGSTKEEYAKIKEMPYVSYCYGKEIKEEKNEDKGAIKREAQTIILVQFQIQKGPCNKNKKSERFSQN
ncbi:hypothetical protein F8M41_009635 [Gigaspora margarita]|uniref:Uncharacterized protein n=1 Tax=Gigaspora margarita TaxID=4874 RepID=A0A8H3X3R2_GIGMA|nr:hypothetical protein F8M41_009635 [Gigaspora margarita]